MDFCRSVALFFLAGLLSLSCQRVPFEEFEISNEWQFKHADSAHWMPARVPGCTHMDLLENGIIRDPFYGNNEKHLQWIGQNPWDYRVSFQGGTLRDKENVELVFEGLDTYADVYLNDSLLFKANNMFRTWSADVKEMLLPGENKISILFFPPEKIEREKASALDYSLPDARGFTRKAPYQYGWDWGPKLVTSGIWKPVLIRTWDEARLGDVYLNPGALTDSGARYLADIGVHASRATTAGVVVTVSPGNTEIRQKNIRLQKGLNKVQVEVTIPEFELWWPAGMGKQPLYTFTIDLKTPGSTDVKTIRTGIRKVELVQEKDSIGESFFFRVNGHPVFMKGANYIPQDNFPARVTSRKYEQTLQTVLDANMNMLRVWGGGIYEEDLFYDLCDENGILIWQDFMFACNMYPGDRDFLENVQQEATGQVKRLRNHPSLALWCGNNEVDEGWKNWGWQKALGYSSEDSAEVWQNYVKIFENILPLTVLTHSPHLPYIPSSPRIGWGHEEALRQGDMHYWGVWWGEEPFEVFEHKVGRFMSEFGFQGFPDMQTLDAVLAETDKTLTSEALLNHQKHPRGMELIRTYMAREYPVPGNFDQYGYVSQLVQAYGMKTALEAHRRAKPRCMGTLYWQLNDCWPVISWSSVDYYNRWKALHYFTRSIFEDYLVSFDKKGDSLAVYVVSDKLLPVEANLKLTLMDFSGSILFEESLAIKVPANSSRLYYQKEIKGIDPENSLLLAVLRNEQGILAKNIHYFAPMKDLKLPQTEINQDMEETREGVRIRLTSPTLAKNVFLSSKVEGFFSDNFFDLLPNQPVEVTFHTEAPVRDLKTEIRIMQFSDVPHVISISE